MPRNAITSFVGIFVAATLLAASGGQAVEKQVPESAAEVQLSFAAVVKRAAPAVVNVYASRVVEQQASPFFSDPFFRRFFGDQGGQTSQRVQRSLGSGVIIDPSGLIVTNYHVIAKADQVKVALFDKREFAAEIVLKDPRSDLAVLRISGAGGNLPTIGFADSDKVEVGDLVLAIGDPFGVGQTVTSGIVSAFAHVPGDQTEDQYFIQTDAAINPGNSGGALVDVNGQLVGINRMIVTPSGGSTGIGFAIPSNLVRVVAGAAQSGHAPKRPWFGATFQAVTPDIADAMGRTAPGGVLVANVDPNGPAAAAHLQSGDLIATIDGNEVDDVGTLNYRLATKGIGNTAKLGIVRDGKQYATTISLQAAPETVPRDSTDITGSSPLAGATVVNLSPAVADEMLFTGKPSGVIVTDVSGDSRAAVAGLRRGDVVVDLNGVPIDSTRTLARVAGQDTSFWQVTINRDGQVIRQAFRG